MGADPPDHSAPPDGERPWTLPAAAGWTALENAGVFGAVLFVGDAPPLVPWFLLAKFPFCVGLVQRRHGAFMLLLFWEASTLAIAIINPALDLFPRLVLVGSSALALWLLVRALPAFPRVELPGRFREER